MRLVFDVNTEVGVVGSGTPYRNSVGWQGMNHYKAELTLIVYSDSTQKEADTVEFSGDGYHILRMLESAAQSIRGMMDVAMKEIGPKRATPCPECDPMTEYPNATHSVDCKQTKFWEQRKAQKKESLQ